MHAHYPPQSPVCWTELEVKVRYAYALLSTDLIVLDYTGHVVVVILSKCGEALDLHMAAVLVVFGTWNFFSFFFLKKTIKLFYFFLNFLSSLSSC